MSADKFEVVNRKTQSKRCGVYIGRPSVLGNPFTHLEISTAVWRVASRDEAIDSYEKWLRDRVTEGDKYIREALDAIPDGATLVCWCAPLRCHADVVRNVLEETRGHI
jgi:hypothetical protein